ncbi:MAG: D-alanyl-D-alanine carboxypeptidase family protein [bacterium]|nr:D-alanyl-D-alanine carboxypeptidase family protein [bacterium]
MSPWIVASLILTAALLLFTPVASTFQFPDNSGEVNRTTITVPVAPLPVGKNLPVPAVSARNVFIMDQNSRTVLWSRNPDEEVLPASTTKMMTALVILEKFNLTDPITVTTEYNVGQHIGFKPGETLTVEQLLYALLVQSANDAAEVLAQNYPGGRPAFIAAMNAKAQEIHLSNTHFVNPSGVDEQGHYSTAADLARLADVALRHPVFAKIVATENAVVATHVLTNVNQLLGKIPGVIGIKTGYTEGAKQALVTLVKRDDHPVILVVLGSDDRFADSAALIDWVYSDFDWEMPLANTPGQ